MIISLVPNLLLRSQITSTLNSLEISYTNTLKAEELLSLVKQNPDARIILDLNASGIDTIALLSTLKSEFSTIPVIGFFSHVDKDIEAKAQSLGIDILMPRSKLFRELPQVLSETGTKMAKNKG